MSKAKEQATQEEIESGYTLVFANGDDEIDYIWVDSLEKAKQEAFDIIVEAEIDFDEIDNFEHMVGIFKGQLKPLEIEFTRTLKIDGK